MWVLAGVCFAIYTNCILGVFRYDIQNEFLISIQFNFFFRLEISTLEKMTWYDDKKEEFTDMNFVIFWEHKSSNFLDSKWQPNSSWILLWKHSPFFPAWHFLIIAQMYLPKATFQKTQRWNPLYLIFRFNSKS